MKDIVLIILKYFWRSSRTEAKKTCMCVVEQLSSTMRRDLLNNVLHLWAGIFLLSI